MLVTALSLITNRTLEAATAFGTSHGVAVVDSFKTAHPLLMALFNIGGIFLLIVVCASVCASFSKNPWEK